jgi:hypothetical protein
VSISTVSLSANLTNQNFTGTAANYSISGYVKDGCGTAISGATIALSGSLSRSATTASNGSYQFTGLTNQGNYTITPTKSSWSFAPVSISTVSLSANLANQNFTGTALFSISGYVRNASGTGISGATVSLSGNTSQTVTTAGNGSYQFFNLSGGSNYTVTATLSGYSFTLVSLSTGSLSANWSNANFTSVTTTYYIEGTVTSNGVGLAGVNMVVSGTVTASTTTASNGYYRFPVLPESGNYVITSSKAGYTFTPASITKLVLSSNQSNNDFTAASAYYIKGYVTNTKGVPLSGVTMTLSGATSATVTTNSNGVYQFMPLALNGNYTVTPTMNGWGFRPTSVNIPSLTGSLDNQSFAGSKKYHIKGSVRTTDGTAVSKAMVMLSGSTSGSVETDSNGDYSFSELPEGSSYTVTAVKNGYAFNPTARSGELLAPIDGWDFFGTYFAEMPQGEIKIIGSASGQGTINPDRGDTAKIFFKARDTGKVELRIFTLTGELVWETSMDNVKEGAFEWVPKNIASGIYIAQVKGPGINTRNRIAILR